MLVVLFNTLLLVCVSFFGLNFGKMQTLRRLAQNREAARKSRLRKKVSEAAVTTKLNGMKQ